MDRIPLPASLLIAGALALGISADLPLRSFPPGGNYSVWLLLLIALPPFIAHRLDYSLVGGWKLLAAPAALCALSLLWRDSPVLCLINVAGALGGCALMTTRTASRRLRESSFFELIHGMLVHVVHASAGAGFLIARVLFSGNTGERGERRALPSLLRGFAAAIQGHMNILVTSANAISPTQ